MTGNQLHRLKVSVVVLAATAILLFVSSRASAGPIFDANADFDAGYAAGTNPNGVWTYGWSSTLTSSLTVYPQHRLLPTPSNGLFMAWDDPANNAALTPDVYKNGGGNYNDGNIDIPAGALILHGGGISGNDLSHLFFTAPAAGNYALSAQFILRQHNVNAADVHILRNGASLFQDVISANGDSAAYSSLLSLLAGDRIDFVVGRSGLGLGPDSIELQATLSSTAVPEPGSIALLGVALGLVVCGWRPRSKWINGKRDIRDQPQCVKTALP